MVTKGIIPSKYYLSLKVNTVHMAQENNLASLIYISISRKKNEMFTLILGSSPKSIKNYAAL